jgi:hypothetical protein
MSKIKEDFLGEHPRHELGGYKYIGCYSTKDFVHGEKGKRLTTIGRYRGYWPEADKGPEKAKEHKDNVFFRTAGGSVYTIKHFDDIKDGKYIPTPGEVANPYPVRFKKAHGCNEFGGTDKAVIYVKNPPLYGDSTETAPSTTSSSPSVPIPGTLSQTLSSTDYATYESNLNNLITASNANLSMVNSTYNNISAKNAELLEKQNAQKEQVKEISDKEKLISTRTRMLQVVQTRNAYKKKIIYSLIALILFLFIGTIMIYVFFTRKAAMANSGK